MLSWIRNGNCPPKMSEQRFVFMNYFTFRPKVVEMPRAGRATHGSQQGWQWVRAAATYEAEEYHLIKKYINYFWQQRKKSKPAPCPLPTMSQCRLRVTRHRLWPQLAIPGHQGHCNKANAAASPGAASPWLCCASTALCSLCRAAARPSLQRVLSLSSACPSLQPVHPFSPVLLFFFFSLTWALLWPS